MLYKKIVGLERSKSRTLFAQTLKKFGGKQLDGLGGIAAILRYAI